MHCIFHSVNIGNDILMRELLLLLHSSTTVMEQHVSNMCPYRPQGQCVYTNISRAVIVNEKNKYSSRASRITNKFLLSLSFCLSQYILFGVILIFFLANVPNARFETFIPIFVEQKTRFLKYVRESK